MDKESSSKTEKRICGSKMMIMIIKKQKQKHGNLENSFKVSYKSLALSIADILSFFCEEKAPSLQSCSTLVKRGRKILIKKLGFTHKLQEKTYEERL
jgi:hypothetical protein